MDAYTNILKDCEQADAQLVAVSKTKPASMITELYNKGQRIFGENKVQELVEKHAELPNDIRWHLIGHLQSNKVKYIASFVDLIHAVDSLKLLKEINKQAKKHDRIIDVLIQIKIAEEESKFGLADSDALDFFKAVQESGFENVRIIGLMGMATFTEDQVKIKTEFLKLKTLFSQLKEDIQADKPYFTELSMGMSGDYNIALECGSTMIRIGSLLFGSRNYNP